MTHQCTLPSCPLLTFSGCPQLSSFDFFGVLPPRSSSSFFRSAPDLPVRFPLIFSSYFFGSPPTPSSSYFFRAPLNVLASSLIPSFPPFFRALAPCVLFSLFSGDIPRYSLLTFLRHSSLLSFSPIFRVPLGLPVCSPKLSSCYFFRVSPCCLLFTFSGRFTPLSSSYLSGALLDSSVCSHSLSSSYWFRPLPPFSHDFFGCSPPLSPSPFFGALPHTVLLSLFQGTPHIVLPFSGHLLTHWCTPPHHPLPTSPGCSPPPSSSSIFGVPLDPLVHSPLPSSLCFSSALSLPPSFQFFSTFLTLLFSYFSRVTLVIPVCSLPPSASFIFGALPSAILFLLF